jgi:hypothetical protein
MSFDRCPGDLAAAKLGDGVFKRRETWAVRADHGVLKECG